MRYIAIPFGWVLLQLYKLFSNYGVAIIVYAIIVKSILSPFQFATRKSDAKNRALQPELDRLEAQFKVDKDKKKYEKAVEDLYVNNKVNPYGGCLLSLVQYPILIALYYAIVCPLSVMMNIPRELLNAGGALMNRLKEVGFAPLMGYTEMEEAHFITSNWDKFAGITQKLIPVDYMFMGLDLSQKPSISAFFHTVWSDPSSVSVGLLIIIPVLIFLVPFLHAILVDKVKFLENGKANSKGFVIAVILPLIMVFFSFGVPAALGLYWLVGSIVTIIIRALLSKHRSKKDKEFTIITSAPAADGNETEAETEADAEVDVDTESSGAPVIE